MQNQPAFLKICHVISGDLWAGAEVMAWRLLAVLGCRADVKLSVVLCNRGVLYDNLKSAGVQTLLLEEKKLSTLKLLSQLQNHLRQEKPHLLHCHRYKENILGYLAGKYANIPALIATQHGQPEPFRGAANIKNNFFSFCSFLIQKQFNTVVAVSSDIQESLISEHRILPRIVSTIRNGVPLPTKLVSGSSHEHFVVGSAGRFVPIKDYDLMVRIATVLSQQDSSFHFSLAGDGPLREQIQASVDSVALSKRFVLTGPLQDMENFYQGLDLYINTSLHEGIPMTILEAMSYGVPVIACDVGGIREIIENGVDGFLVPSREPQALAEKCLLLRRDKDLWRKISAAARHKIETKFSDVFMAEQYLALYRRILEGKNIILK